MADAQVLARVRGRMVDHGFPAKLLPDCIITDHFDSDTGAFRVQLDRSVDTRIDGFPVRYAKVITGVIKPNQITGLSGVRAKKMLWIPITGIDAERTVLQFRVGPITQPVSRSAFD